MMQFLKQNKTCFLTLLSYSDDDDGDDDDDDDNNNNNNNGIYSRSMGWFSPVNVHYHSMQIFLPFHWPRTHHVTCK